MQLRNATALATATLAAAALPTIVLMALVATIASDEITRDEWWIVFGVLFGIALAHVVLLGVPVALVLRRIGRWGVLPMGIAGLLVGALPYGIFSFPRGDKAGVDVFNDGVQTMANGVTTAAGWMDWLQEAAVFGVLGVLGALAYFAAHQAVAQKAKGAVGALR
jgi:hypothetical protein